MHHMNAKLYPKLLLTSIFLLAGSSAYAGDASNISNQMKTEIKGSMEEYIAKQTVDGKLYVFDAIQNKLLKLTFDELHANIVHQNGVYLTCADFTDQDGIKIDIDFMVRATANNSYITTQTIVHAVDQKYRPYHVGDRND